MAKVIALLALSVAYASAASVTLTAANFESEVVTSGKNAFIKFQAPWFVHQTLYFFPAATSDVFVTRSQLHARKLEGAKRLRSCAAKGKGVVMPAANAYIYTGAEVLGCVSLELLPFFSVSIFHVVLSLFSSLATSIIYTALSFR